jgi:hypothetical protein
MRLPRFRIRTLMIAVAVVATMSWVAVRLRQRSERFYWESLSMEGRRIEWAAGAELYEYDCNRAADPLPDDVRGAIRHRRRANYYLALQRKYRDAARRPWLPVPPDPPPPE